MMKHYDGTGRGPGRASVADCLVSTGQRISLIGEVQRTGGFFSRLAHEAFESYCAKTKRLLTAGVKILTTTFTCQLLHADQSGWSNHDHHHQCASRRGPHQERLE
jgi:hypothetical protein